MFQTINLTAMTPLTPDQTLEVSGIIPAKAKYITLGLGKNMNDLAFYMEVRFEKNELVFNTREDCNWGKEIVKANPFVEGGRFEVRVDYTEHNFVAIINGKDTTIPNKKKIYNTEMVLLNCDLILQGFNVKPTH